MTHCGQLCPNVLQTTVRSVSSHMYRNRFRNRKVISVGSQVNISYLMGRGLGSLIFRSGARYKKSSKSHISNMRSCLLDAAAVPRRPSPS